MHLINFSCFPSGDSSSVGEFGLPYTDILKFLDKVIPRENASREILHNSGVKTNLGFDCLPRFIDRYNLTNSHSPLGHVLLSGGVNFDDKRLEFYVNLIGYLLRQNINVKFLLGAKSSLAQEDIRLKEILKENLSTQKIKFVEAQTMSAWIHEFQTASFLFSARFHHTIAALSVGTPFNFLQSNTPKISSVLDTLGDETKVTELNEVGMSGLKAAIHEALDKMLTNKSEDRVRKMLTLAAKNFD